MVDKETRDVAGFCPDLWPSSSLHPPMICITDEATSWSDDGTNWGDDAANCKDDATSKG